jgi:hypothetical protein
MAIMRARRTLSKASTANPRPPASAVVPVGRAHVLDVPFAMRAVANAAGARWDPERSVMVWRGEVLPPSLHPFLPAPYSWEARVERETTGAKAAPSKPTGALKPRPHQSEAVRVIAGAHAAGRPGFLLADDVGLGKTITAW